MLPRDNVYHAAQGIGAESNGPPLTHFDTLGIVHRNVMLLWAYAGALSNAIHIAIPFRSLFFILGYIYKKQCQLT